MGSQFTKPEKEGPSPYTRSGVPPPKLVKASNSDKPRHRLNDPMSLELHMRDHRQRAEGLSSAEREWRKKWVLDQHLHPDEPIKVDAVFRQLNPIRRLYRAPWDYLYRAVLEPSMGAYWGTITRQLAPKAGIALLIMWTVYYRMKYEAKDWTFQRGSVAYITPKPVLSQKPLMEAEHPGLLEKGLWRPEQYDYLDHKFFKRTAHLDLGPPQRPW
uniref:NADH dehydrogenase [ubiquinone] 1 beta subcomplex subunit 6 n=1 Tax=Plectus sambesii TaxID=2011161 RepID=A0A914WEG9_9BILA